MSTVNALTFSALRMANERRQAEWPGNDQIDKAFRALETAGEGGELAEAIEAHLRASLQALAVSGSLGRVSEQMKKFLRAERGIKGSSACVGDIAREIGDCIIALDLLANDLGIDLGDTVASKFNETSIKYDLETRLRTGPDSVGDLKAAIMIADAVGQPDDLVSRSFLWFGILDAVQRERILECAEKISSAYREMDTNTAEAGAS